jgi:pSer/pThr/pTyr-binding forkhead associated (FHA) protein
MELVHRDRDDRPLAVPLVDGALTIGREATRDLVLRDPQVSRLHAVIETIAGVHLLRDAGSANGTYLNGLRLRGGSAVSLRAGDVIDLGRSRLFLRGSVGSSTARLPASPAGIETSVALDDLVREGTLALGAGASTARARLASALAGVSPSRGIEQALGPIAAIVEACGVAVYLGTEGEAVSLVASRPLDTGRRLAPLVHRVWSRGGGTVVCTPDEEPCPELEDTADAPATTSSAAVAFQTEGLPAGVIAVERAGTPRLDRTDLARLAVIGRDLGWLRALRGNPNDTRPVGVA